METAFVGPGRAGLGHATGRNGPGPKLNSGPRAGPGREVYGPGRADKIRPVQTYGTYGFIKKKLFKKKLDQVLKILDQPITMTCNKIPNILIKS